MAHRSDRFLFHTIVFAAIGIATGIVLNATDDSGAAIADPTTACVVAIACGIIAAGMMLRDAMGADVGFLPMQAKRAKPLAVSTKMPALADEESVSEPRRSTVAPPAVKDPIGFPSLKHGTDMPALSPEITGKSKGAPAKRPSA